MLYPQQNDIRNQLDLSGFWSFQLDPDNQGEAQGWFSALPAPRTIAVPASWNEQFQDTRDYMDAAWYARTFYVPQGWRGQRIQVRVGSANYAARVWINDTLAGEHQGGHLPFDLDVTELVTWEGPNRLTIRVDNTLLPTRVPPGNVGRGVAGFMGSYPNTNFDFFPYGGLHRPVILYAVPTAHIADVTVVTGIEGRDGTVQVRVAQQGGSLPGKLTLTGQDGTWEADLAFEDGQAKAAIRVPSARFWQPGDPYLYQLTVTLVDGERVADRYALDVGIRTVEVQGDRLLLNGQPIFMAGFGKHEDFPVHGRGLDLPLVVKDYALLKWIGANSYRTSHYPYSEEAMLMADREGILIVDEIPAVGLSFEDGETNMQTRLAQCKLQLHELIARDKNHPSVIMWSVANEPMPGDMMRRFANAGAQDVSAEDAAGTAFLQELFDLARQLDPTRPRTMAGMMGAPGAWLDLSDVVFINRYWGWYTQAGHLDEGAAALAQELDALYDTMHKPMVISEFGADTISGMHSDPPEMWSEEYQVEMLRRYLDAAASRPFVVGLHVWNFADFKTGQGTRRAGGLNMKGVFTRDRRPKMAAHFLRQCWTQPQPAVQAAAVEPAAPSAAEPAFRDLLAGVARRLEQNHPGTSTSIRFDVQDEGIYRLIMTGDGRAWVEDGDGEAAATISFHATDGIKLLTGKLSPMIAVTTGKIKVQGDMQTLSILQRL